MDDGVELRGVTRISRVPTPVIRTVAPQGPYYQTVGEEKLLVLVGPTSKVPGFL
jgi:hypothetical protein